MDCAPTVGVGGEPGSPIKNDAARRAATHFEKWNCVIKTSLPVRNASYKRLIPSVSFAAVSLLEYGGLKPILPIPEGRSDATRRAASLSSHSPFPLMPVLA